jgi:hypothetical protein
VVFREAYNMAILYVWYTLIDIHYMLLHGKFENGLSISVSKNRTSLQKFANGNRDSFTGIGV